MRFEDALQEHLAAIRARDLHRLAGTVVPDDLVLITSGGEVSAGTARFLQLHREWFASETWTIDTEVLHARVGTDLATCVLRLRYRDRNDRGEAIVEEGSILALTFALVGGRWLLAQDQNTPIR